MTYAVSSGTLIVTIPCHTIPSDSTKLQHVKDYLHIENLWWCLYIMWPICVVYVSCGWYFILVCFMLHFIFPDIKAGELLNRTVIRCQVLCVVIHSFGLLCWMDSPVKLSSSVGQSAFTIWSVIFFVSFLPLLVFGVKLVDLVWNCNSSWVQGYNRPRCVQKWWEWYGKVMYGLWDGWCYTNRQTKENVQRVCLYLMQRGQK